MMMICTGLHKTAFPITFSVRRDPSRSCKLLRLIYDFLRLQQRELVHRVDVVDPSSKDGAYMT